MAKQELDNTPAEEVKELISLPTCTHHWVIETPLGPMSKGKCKICGEEKEFSNQWRPNNTIGSGWDNSKEAPSDKEQKEPPAETSETTETL